MIRHMQLVLTALVVGCCLCNETLADDDRPCGPASLQGPLSKLIPQGAYGADFRPACRQHDDCYDTCAETRKQCDKDFLCNMVEACSCSNRPRLCRQRARMMYLSVRLLGRRSYCNED